MYRKRKTKISSIINKFKKDKMSKIKTIKYYSASNNPEQFRRLSELARKLECSFSVVPAEIDMVCANYDRGHEDFYGTTEISKFLSSQQS